MRISFFNGSATVLSIFAVACSGSSSKELFAGDAGAVSDGGTAFDPATKPAPGNAKGTAFSGRYEVKLMTTSCSGQCGPAEIIKGLPHSYCDVGDTDSESWELTQANGDLETDEVDLSFRMRASGGIDSNGSFNLSGFATHLAGALEGTISIRGTAALPDDGGSPTMRGSAQAHTRGNVDGKPIDCVATFDFEPKPTK